MSLVSAIKELYEIHGLPNPFAKDAAEPEVCSDCEEACDACVSEQEVAAATADAEGIAAFIERVNGAPDPRPAATRYPQEQARAASVKILRTRTYHWRWGVHFTRMLDSGDVMLTVPAHDLTESKSWTIPAAEWVSLVTEVSGEPTSYPAHHALHAPAEERQSPLEAA